MIVDRYKIIDLFEFLILIKIFLKLNLGFKSLKADKSGIAFTVKGNIVNPGKYIKKYGRKKTNI